MGFVESIDVWCTCRGKGFPSILETSIDAPLSITHGLNTKSNAQATHGLPPIEPAGRNGEPVVAPAETVWSDMWDLLGACHATVRLLCR